MSAYDEDDDEQLLTKWQPPSFDPPKPPKKPKAPPIQYPTVEEVEEIRSKARQDAYDMGLSEGFSKGRTDGFEQGQKEGYDAGYLQGYSDAEEETKRLHVALNQLLESIDGMPEAISEPMIDLSYAIAMRVAANERMTRAPLICAMDASSTASGLAPTAKPRWPRGSTTRPCSMPGMRLCCICVYLAATLSGMSMRTGRVPTRR